jgi:hypothetical protein
MMQAPLESLPFATLFGLLAAALCVRLFLNRRPR